MKLRPDSIPPVLQGASGGIRGSGFLTVAACLLAAVILLPGLGHKILTNWDEGIYAEVARELLRGKSASALTWNYRPWLEKPPLFFWATGAAYRIFGVNEFSARAVSALSGVGAVGLVHGWLRLRLGLGAAWLGSLTLLATFGFQHICHVGELDTMLALWATVALVGLAEIEIAPRSSGAGWSLFWGGFAAAAMTKGAAAIVLPLALVATALAGRWTRARFGWPSVLGLFGFLAAVLPWHLLMWRRFGDSFLREYFGYHVLSRALHPIESHPTHWWFYLWVLLISSAPFCLLLPWSVGSALRSPMMRPWAVLPLVTVLLYSLVQTRLPQYIAPVYPALAVVNAAFVADLLRAPAMRARLQTAAAWNGLLLGALLLYGAAAAATAHARGLLHSAAPAGPYRSVDERGTVALLRQVFPTTVAAGTPLLIWRDGTPRSVATTVFYAQRPVQQVLLNPADDTAPPNLYQNSPERLDEALAAGGRFLLLDRSLLPALPAEVSFRQIAGDADEAIGWIELRTVHGQQSAFPAAPLPETGTRPARRESVPADGESVPAR